MFGRRTRDLIVETATVVRGLEKSLKEHNDDNDEKFEAMHDLIEKCSENCPAEQRFDAYVTSQNGSLARIEKKVNEERTAKKTRKELFTEMAKYITVAALVIGSFLAYLEYRDSCKKKEATKIEVMLQKILEK